MDKDTLKEFERDYLELVALQVEAREHHVKISEVLGKLQNVLEKEKEKDRLLGIESEVLNFENLKP